MSEGIIVRYATFFLAVLLIAAPGSLPAVPSDDVPSLDSLRQSYEQSVQKQQVGAGTALLGKLDDYRKALSALADKFQKAGDLEGLLACKQEQERFEMDKQIPLEPASGTPAAIAKLQTDYRKSVAQMETDKYSGLLALTEKYVGQLNALKKQLTVQGEIDEALKMKAEVERVKTSAPVAAAEFAIAELGARTAAATAPAGEDQATLPCAHCGGTGRVAPSCPKCKGTGRCSACGGKGMVPSQLKGTKGNIRCVPCKGTGKCRECSGPDKQVACTICQGTGKVAKPLPPKGKQPPSSGPAQVAVAPPAKDSASGSPVKGSADAELDQYLETMAVLHKQFQDGVITKVEADKAFASPLKFAGKVLQSKVYLVNGHPRGVRVAPTYDDIPKGGNLLIPYSMEVGTKAQETSKDVGANGQVVITYGVVSRDNITLFAITR